MILNLDYQEKQHTLQISVVLNEKSLLVTITEPGATEIRQVATCLPVADPEPQLLLNNEQCFASRQLAELLTRKLGRQSVIYWGLREGAEPSVRELGERICAAASE